MFSFGIETIQSPSLVDHFGYRLSWLKDNNGKKYKIFFHEFHGLFSWDQWIRNDLLKRKILKQIEPELRRLDKTKDIFHKLDSIADVRSAELGMIRILSHLSDIAKLATFTHPRSGRLFIVGMKDKTKYKSFSSAMILTAYEVFRKAYKGASEKIILVDDIEDAFQIIIETNSLYKLT